MKYLVLISMAIFSQCVMVTAQTLHKTISILPVGSRFSESVLSDDGHIGTIAETVTNPYHEYIMKLDTMGNPVWQSQINFDSSRFTALINGHSLCTAPSNGFLTAIQAETPSGDFLLQIDRIRSDGSLAWCRIIGDSANWINNPVLSQVPDGFMLNCDVSAPNAQWNNTLIKLDTAGNIRWSRTIGSNHTCFSDVINVPDHSGYVVAAKTNNNGDLTLMRIDTAGNLVWSHKYTDGNGNSETTVFRLMVYNNRIYMLTPVIANGPTYSGISAFDLSGNQLWGKRFRANDNQGRMMDMASCNGGLNLCGYDITGNSYQGLVLRTDTSGNLLWSHQLDSTTGYAQCQPNEILCTPGKYSLLLGINAFTRVNENGWLGCFDGNYTWTDTLLLRSDSFGQSISAFNLDSYPALASLTSVNVGSSIICMSNTAGIPPSNEAELPEFIQSPGHLYVSLNGNETYSLSIYDMQGKLVYSIERQMGSAEIDTSPFRDGIYVVNILNSNMSFRKKILVLN